MFFLASSVIMLLGVFLGFAPSFFVRGAFHNDALPWWLALHGIAQSAWFVLFAAQCALITGRRREWHRRLGWATTVVALIVLATTPLVLTRSVPRGFDAGLTFVQVSFVTIVGILRMPFFLVCVSAGVMQRQKPATHKRAMLMASLCNFAPATSRMSGMIGVHPLVGALVYTVAFGIAIVRHDRAALGHVHPWSKWGLAGLFAILIIPILLVASGGAHAIIDPLR